jgi:uncharacterized protein YegP (UPF0339 family)
MEAMAGTQRVFQIFSDWHGRYRWMLTDSDGRWLRESRFGYEAPSGALRDAEGVKLRENELARAEIVRPPYAI